MARSELELETLRLEPKILYLVAATGQLGET